MSDQKSMADVDKEMNPILKKENYEYWRTMTEASLVFLGCWDAVQPGFAPAEMMKPECIKMDNKARAYIFRHVRRPIAWGYQNPENSKGVLEGIRKYPREIHVDGHCIMHARTRNNGEDP